MGQSYSIRCSKCKRKYEFTEGVGMLCNPIMLMDINNEHNLLSYYKNGINKEKLKQILIDKNYMLDKNYGYKTYQCPTCKNIYNNFYFKLYSIDDAEVFTSAYECSKCKKILQIARNINSCPNCGGELDKETMEIIMWD